MNDANYDIDHGGVPEHDAASIESGRPGHRRRIMATGLIVGLLGGGIAGLVIGTPMFVSAEGGDNAAVTTTVAETATTEATDDTTGETKAPPAAQDDEPPATTAATDADTDEAGADDKSADKDSGASTDRVQKLTNHFKTFLDGLVEDGIITREQADKVNEKWAEARKAFEGFRSKGPKGGQFGWKNGRNEDGVFGRAFGNMRDLYDAIGLPPMEIAQQLMDGKTLAEIAEAHGVDRQDLIDAVVDPMKEALDSAVADGKMTREKADERLAHTTETITAAIDGKMPSGWKDFGRHGVGRGGDAPTPDADGGD